ncbi:MAG: ERAP1-like C-terminal domain-containing protein, partial [Bdellovibrionales bacterium]|nr:ERAP1-like C-terminal domain-containing protein [Bdellovibrionales bacterium]
AKKFQKGIQNYIKKFAEGNTELKDFIDSIGDAYGSDLSEWQKQWLQTASLNTIGIKLKCDRGKIESFYVEQEAPQAFDVLRSHRFKIALFQSKSSRLMTPLVFSAQISDQETSVPEALGKACPALIYPNYEDYGYMKLKLDSNTITELPSLIRQLPRAFERQLFWAALWDMVEDTHLDLVKFGELATQNLNKEKDPETLRAILRYLHGYYSKGSSVLFYLPKDSEKEVTFYNRFVSKLEGIIWQQLLKAKPNSEHQKIWLLSFIETARTPNGLNHLNQLLSGKVKLKGLPIDQDKRWEIIVKLASFNFRNSEILIAEEAKRDPSSSGKLGMLSAQASIPLLANKESWLNEIEKEDSSYSLDQQRAIINELFPAHQISLETQAGASFYDRLAILAQKREGPFLVLYSRLIPNICAEEQNIKIGAFLKENLKLHPGLEKRLKVYRELGDRCRDIRSLVRKEHETRAH